MFMLQFGIACCSIEMMHTYSVKHDLDRFAAGVPGVGLYVRVVRDEWCLSLAAHAFRSVF
jgi:hypothetical protein